MRRYLLYISYIGTRFGGMQKQMITGERSLLKCETVQELIEIALEKLKPVNTPVITLSSRTDRGVHALCNTAHVDLKYKKNTEDYDAGGVTACLNNAFIKSGASVRIRKTVVVPDTFHARYSAVKRNYLYRLAVFKPRLDELPRTTFCFSEFDIRKQLPAFLPIAECYRCHLICNPFDTEKFCETGSLFQGTNDFMTFMHSPGKKRFYMQDRKSTVRTIEEVRVTPGKPLFNPELDPLYENLDFWDISFKAHSFLHKQVRRMVGAMIAVGQGRLTIENVKYMLENPSFQNWNPRAVPAPPQGLFLVGIEYDPKSFIKNDHSSLTGTR